MANDPEDFFDVYVQPESEDNPWTATPILLFSYLFVIYGGFLSFTISNTIALWVETGFFQWAEPVLFYHSRGHQWEPTYQNVNWFSIALHLLALCTMFSYPPRKKKKYDWIEEPILVFSLMLLSFVWGFYQFVSDPTPYTTELLQTDEGIFLAQTIFRGLMLLQFFTSFFLLVFLLVTSRPLIRVPDDIDGKYFLMFLYLPFVPPYFFQYSKQDGSLNSILFFILYYGLIYLKVYVDNR